MVNDKLMPTVTVNPVKAQTLWGALMFALFPGIVLAILLFATLTYQLWYLERAYPGVMVADINVGGMSPPEMMLAVNQHAPDYLAQNVTIQAGTETWLFTGQQLGLRLDANMTATKAYAVGRTDNFLADMLTQLRLWVEPRVVAPIIVYDTGPTNQLLQQLADHLYRPPQDAQLTIQADGRVNLVPSQRGRQMHLESTRALIQEAVLAQNNQPVVAIMQEIMPAVTENDLQPAYQQAVNFLHQPLTMGYTVNGKTSQWQLAPQTLMTMINLVQSVDAKGKTRFTIEPDRAKLITYLQQKAESIATKPVNGSFRFDMNTNTLTVVQPSTDGYTLDVEAAYQKIVAAKNQSSNYLELPLVFTPPPLSSKEPQNLGIKELVSEATTYFRGSSESRMHNIRLAASKFHGIIIPPGETFSFNHYLGEVTAENGYDLSLIIRGDRTALGIGGGICQVSTTVFRTALFGGFEIVERWAHDYRVNWYETNSSPGLDATIYTPDVDLKFRNNTPYYLLIQTETDLTVGTLTFRFYSTKTGREVTIAPVKTERVVPHGPAIYEKDPTRLKGTMEQVDWAKDGVDVTVTRTVTQTGQLLYKDEIFSHYRPWQDVYKVGTKE